MSEVCSGEQTFAQLRTGFRRESIEYCKSSVRRESVEYCEFSVRQESVEYYVVFPLDKRPSRFASLSVRGQSVEYYKEVFPFNGRVLSTASLPLDRTVLSTASLPLDWRVLSTSSLPLSPFLIGRMFLREPSWKYSVKLVGS